MSDLGKTIRSRRKALGIDQTALAAELGVSKSYLSHIEAGRRPVPAIIAGVLADRLGAYETDSRLFRIEVEGAVARVRAMTRVDALRAAAELPPTAWEDAAVEEPVAAAPEEAPEPRLRQNGLGGWEYDCPEHGVVASGPDRPMIEAAGRLHDDHEDPDVD